MTVFLSPFYCLKALGLLAEPIMFDNDSGNYEQAEEEDYNKLQVVLFLQF